MAKNIVTIPDYVSDESDNEIQTNNAQTSKRRNKRNRNWEFKKTYENKKDAIDDINKEDTWNYAYTIKTKMAKKYTSDANKQRN